MNMIRPVSDLRNNFADISKTVHETAQPVFFDKEWIWVDEEERLVTVARVVYAQRDYGRLLA